MEGARQMEDGISVRVRVDDQGLMHFTIIEWDEDGREIAYREDENFSSAVSFTNPLSFE